MTITNPANFMGLHPLSNINGDVGHTSRRVYNIPATNTTDIYIGDLVYSTGLGSDTENPQFASGGELPNIAKWVPGSGTTTLRPLGVVAGFEYDGTFEKVGTKYCPALTQRYAIVIDDGNEEYVATVAGQFAAADCALNVDLILSQAANQAFGFNGYGLDVATKAVTATLPIRLMRAWNYPGNSIVTNNSQWVVKINNNEHGNSTGVA